MKIAIIGLGEVGSNYGLGLAKGGADVYGYSPHMNSPYKKERMEELKQGGIHLAYSVEELVRDAKIILAVTTTKAAEETAESVKPFLEPGQIYVEFNSAIPAVKEKIAEKLGDVVEVVDGTTMASVNQLKHKTPVNMSGSKAKEVSEILNAYGMNTHYVGEKMGQAAALKVLRSIFMKGFEAVLVECMQASNYYGVANQVLESILKFFETKPLPDLMHMFITTNAIHCKRRAEEIKSIAEMLEDQCIENTMSRASFEKLMWISSLGMEQYFNGVVPKETQEVFDILSLKTKI